MYNINDKGTVSVVVSSVSCATLMYALCFIIIIKMTGHETESLEREGLLDGEGDFREGGCEDTINCLSLI